MRTRWNGIRGASVAAGVCLSSAASVVAAAADEAAFESEFEIAAESSEVAPPEAEQAQEASVVGLDIAIAEAGTPATADAEQALGIYLDRLVRRAEDVDVMPDCLPEKPLLAAGAIDLYDVLGDTDEATEAAWREVMDELAGTPAAERITADADAGDRIEVLADADEATEAAWRQIMDELAGTPSRDRSDLVDVLADADDATEVAWREVMDELAGTPAPEQLPGEPAAAVSDEPAVPDESSAIDLVPEEESVRLDFFP